MRRTGTAFFLALLSGTSGLALLVDGCEKAPTARETPSAPKPSSGASAPSGPTLPQGELTYHFGGSEERTLVTFEAESSAGRLQGWSRQLSGNATINFDAGQGRCHMSVPVMSMTTGMVGPDNAMQGRTWLDAQRFPAIEFKGEKVSFTRPTAWRVEGEFTMKGVANPLCVTADVRPIPQVLVKKFELGEGQWVRVRTAFPVKLSDHGISIPKGSLATVGDEWSVKAEVYGSTVRPPEPSSTGGTNEEDRPPRPKVIQPPKEAGRLFRLGVKPAMTNVVAEGPSDVGLWTVTTRVIGGWVAYDKEKGTGKVILTVPVKALKTGIRARDQALLGPEWLDAGNHPDIDFEGTSVAQQGGGPLRVQGNLTIRGVTRPISAEVEAVEVPAEKIREARWGDDEGLRFKTRFAFKLSDFGIKVPEKLAGKVNDEWTLKMDLLAVVSPGR